jgi:hypothetical protein
MSTFPIALGAKITGVDETTFTAKGTPFSMVIMPHSHNTTPAMLQKDDVSIAYDFARRYPGYTADNLETNGVHAVPQRRFVLISADHPLVTALHENQDQLQMSEVTQMPEQMLKIGASMYETLMPLVKQQVKSQLKVADMSTASVQIEPADFSSWVAASEQLISDALAPVNARRSAELAGTADRGGAEADGIRKKYGDLTTSIENEMLHKPMEFFCELRTQYNFL